jgi:acyl carrier protein
VTFFCLNVHPMNFRPFPSAILAVLWVSLLACGCGSPPNQSTVDRVRSEVATILQKESAQINVATPLVTQGADDLDIVEIVMAVEDAFKVEIPDSDISEASKSLTVQKLAEIVSRQLKSK